MATDRDTDKSLIKTLAAVIVAGFIMTSIIVGCFVWLIGGRLNVAPRQVLAEVESLKAEITATAALRAESETFRQMMQSSSLAVAQIDRNGIITLWSDGAEDLFQIKRKDAEGYGVAFIMPSGGREKHKKGFRAFMASDTGESLHQVIQCDIVIQGKATPATVETWGRAGRLAVAVITLRDPHKRADNAQKGGTGKATKAN